MSSGRRPSTTGVAAAIVSVVLVLFSVAAGIFFAPWHGEATPWLFSVPVIVAALLLANHRARR